MDVKKMPIILRCHPVLHLVNEAHVKGHNIYIMTVYTIVFTQPYKYLCSLPLSISELSIYLTIANGYTQGPRLKFVFSYKQFISFNERYEETEWIRRVMKTK